MIKFESYEEFLKAFKSSGEESKDATLLLHLQDWLNTVFLNISEDDMDFGLDEFSIAGVNSNQYKTDILTHISGYCENAIKHIEGNMREKIIRENVLMPVYKAKELSGYGINWLSRKPGRTIKEKLSGTNSVIAVKRRMSIDTGENRLFVAFMKQLRDLYELKTDNFPKNYLSYEEADFYQMVLNFLSSEEITEIQKWENIPPNNTLLSDMDYKKIWRSWNDIKDIDLFIRHCSDNIEECLVMMLFFELLSELKSRFLIPQIPLYLNYPTFTVNLIIPDISGVDQNGDIINISKKSDKIILLYKSKAFEIYFEDSVLKVFENGENIISLTADINEFQEYARLISDKIGSFALNKIKKASSLKKVRSLAIDLFDITPSYINDDGISEELPCRMLQQEISAINTGYRKKYFQSCKNSDAIILDNSYFDKGKINTYTISSAIEDESGEQMKLLFQMLSGKLATNNFTFIFPDIFDEFQLSLVHKTARLSYHNVKSFPKSIGIAFDYQTYDCFSEKFNMNDFLLIADIVDDKLSFTLVKGVYSPDVHKKIPQYNGVMWERHPTFSKSIIKYTEQVKHKLREDGCKTPGLLYKIFGFSGLLQETDKLTCFFDKNSFYRISNSTKEILNSVKIPVTEAVEEFLKEQKSIVGDSPIHIILLNEALTYLGKLDSIYASYNASLKGHHLHESLKNTYNIPLWRDHLPDLAIKKLYGKFDLVNHATVLPNFNSSQNIRIDNTFTLVKGKNDYHFDLIKNDTNSKTQYEAVIKNPAFPLKNDIECELKMTYYYGAENPYELLFVPINKEFAGFNEAKVIWKRKISFPYEDLEYPKFPEGSAWKDFSEYNGRKGKGAVNLLRWLDSFFKKLDTEFASVNKKDLGFSFKELEKGTPFEKRILIDGEYKTIIFEKRNLMEDYDKTECASDMISFNLKPLRNNLERLKINLKDSASGSIWQKNKNDYSCTGKIFHHGTMITISFSKKDFKNASEFSTECTKLCFDLGKPEKGKYHALNIVPEEIELKYPSGGTYIATDIRKGVCPDLKTVSNGFMFMMHTIFFNGKSIYDEGCPKHLKDLFKQRVNKWIKICCECDDYNIRNRLFTMMSLMSSDIGNDYYIVAEEFINRYKNGKSKLSDSIGYALGDLRSENQKKLLSQIKELKDQKAICILARAVWKNKKLIFNLPEEDVLYYFDAAATGIMDLYESNPKKFKKDVSMYIEFIIAAFRLRELKKEKLLKILSMNNEKVKNLYNFVEQIIAEKIKIKTHLQLEVNKKGEFANSDIPDLLFVLLTYITGNSGESDIRISGVSADD